MATCTTFSYNGGPPKTLNATIVTAQLLGKLFQLDPASICLLDDAGGFYENGDIKHLSNEKKYDVNGNSLSAMSPAPVGQQANNGVVTFTRDETKNLENSVIQRTGDMFAHLEGVAKAPSAVQKIQMLSILAACASDLSLVNDTTADRIELLTMPKSFKASLVQVVNEATEAFLKADIGMTRIKMNLATIPQTLVTSIEVAADPDDPAGAKILERNREKIDQVAKSCSAECKDVADKFSKVMALIDELIEVGTATQGVNEEQMKKLESIKREYEERQKHLAQQQKKMEHDIEKQKEETKLALDDYKEKAAQMGDLGNVFAACMTDTLNSVVRGAVRLVENTVESAKDLAKNVSHQVVNIGTDDKTPKFAHNKAKGYEAGLLNFVENHYSDQLPPLEELKKNAEQTIYCFEQFLKVKAASPEGQFLQKACKEYTKLLQDVAHMPSVYPNLVAQFDVIQIAAQTARKKIEEERAREAEKLKAAAGIMEQMNTSASQSQTNYQNMRKREDELENKVWKVREELSELISKLANTAEEKLDLTDIIEYLAKGLTELGNLKESWVQQQLFFASIADTVSKPMAETLKSFMDQQKDLTDTPSSKRLKKCLIQTAMEACAICLQIRQCATIYHEVSQTYVIPGITNVTQNLQLTKSEAKNKFITMQNKSDELERKVLSLIKERKGQMLTDTVGQITNYTGQLAITDN